MSDQQQSDFMGKSKPSAWAARDSLRLEAGLCLYDHNLGPDTTPVAMGYVNIEAAAVGTELNALVHGKQLPLKVAKMPFVPQRYYRG